MKKILPIVVSIALISSCKPAQKDYKFKNDLENIYGWFEQNQIVKDDAHSGIYSCKITPEAHFGITFRRKLSDFNNAKPVKIIRVGAWFRLSQVDSKGALTISLDNPDNLAPIVFNSIRTQDFIKEPIIWTYLTNQLEIPANTDLNKVVSIYATNDGSSNIFVDDISYEFE